MNGQGKLLDWDAMVTFHTQQGKKLLSAMQPYLI